MGVYALKDGIKCLMELNNEIGEIKPNTKNVYFGIGGETKNNAWVESIYCENDVLMIKFRVSVPAKDWGCDWAFCTDKAENFLKCFYLDNKTDYVNEVNGVKFTYSSDDVMRCGFQCVDYCNWYREKDKTYNVSFG